MVFFVLRSFWNEQPAQATAASPQGKEAVEAYKKAVSFDPSSPEAPEEIGVKRETISFGGKMVNWTKPLIFEKQFRESFFFNRFKLVRDSLNE